MIYVFLAEGFEEIEALTPVDVLRRAGLEVSIVGVTSKTVTGSHGIAVMCDLTVQEVDMKQAQMILLPGGMPGTLNLEKSQEVQKYIDDAVINDIWIAAICAAPTILGHKGLLKGKEVICFPGYEEQLEGACISGEIVCVDGKFVTAKGMGVSTEFSLKLVELLVSAEKANALHDSLQCRI